MAERIAVTPETVRIYLQKILTPANYHLAYGLSLLPQNRFIAVVDALINNDLQVEELSKLSGFTIADADALLAVTQRSWVSPATAEPRVGDDGYLYLTRKLNLASIVGAAPTGWNAGRLVSAEVAVGTDRGYETVEAAETVFRQRVLPNALLGNSIAMIFPADETEVHALPIMRADPSRKAMLSAWYSQLFEPLMGSAPNGSELARVVSLGGSPSVWRNNPGLTQWVVFEPRPAPDFHLLLRREAGVRSISGPYTAEEISRELTELEGMQLSPVGAGRRVAYLDFRSRVVSAAVEVEADDRTDLKDRAIAVADAIQALYDHRDRVRAYLKAALDGCESAILGHYPPN